MKPVRVKVIGLKETEAALKALNEQVGTGRAARRVGLRALRAGGEILAKEARQRAPKFEMYLSESIDVSTRLTKSQRAAHKKFAPVEMFVGPNNPAAIPQEFGTFKEPPQPFMRPAWDATKDQVLKRIADTLMVDVERTAKREAAKAARLARKAAGGK